MKLGKRRQDAAAPDPPDATVSVADSSAPPVADSWTGAGAAQPPVEPAAEPLIYAEPVVEGEAVELPAAEPASPIYEPPTAQASSPTPYPVAEQPVTAVESAPGAGPAPVASLGDSGEAFASGHAAAPGPSWQEPLIELANERPEVVVGAAFAGGVIAAMILRRLGN
jgi:hypothetical protein